MKTNPILGIFILALLAGSSSVYAQQGQVEFIDYGGIGIQVYAAQSLSGDNTTIT